MPALQIWGQSDVTTANLNAAKQAGNVILAFQEPELASGANIPVQVRKQAHAPPLHQGTMHPCEPS
jgi:hypothetical protein